MINEPYDFPLFYAIWAATQKWKIPEVHLKLIRFIEDEQWDNDTKVLLLWRGVGKSTLIDLWVAYKLSKNPTLRFLILSADHKLAKQGSQDILFIIRTHPLCTHLISDQLETRKDSFFVRGHSDQRNPSVLAHGITSNVTGGRADYIIYDDVEVQRNAGTVQKRLDLRRRIAETTHLLVPEVGRRLFIGTYHDPESIYDEETANGASTMRMPIMSDVSGEFPYLVGKSNWDERFPAEYIEQKQKQCTGRAEFYSQYLLIPSSIEDSTLDPVMIQGYSGELEIFESNRMSVAKIGEQQIVSVTTWWDPSLGGSKNDDSILAVVFTSSDGQIFIHRTIKLVGDVDEQCIQVKRTALQLSLPMILIETNGIGNFLPQVLLKHLNGTGIGVEGICSTQNKNQKIIEAFETPLYGKFLHAHQSVLDSKFTRQMRDFNPSITTRKDDYLDAVASAIKNEPIRIAGIPGRITNGINSWTGSSNVEIERDTFTF